jgi:hypothetical protein
LRKQTSAPFLRADVARDLSEALRIEPLPEKFTNRIAIGLQQYVEFRDSWPKCVETEREIDRLLTAAASLKRDLAATLPRLYRKHHQVVLEELNELRGTIETMFSLLHESEGIVETDYPDPPHPGRRGNPHKGRDELRQNVLEAIEDSLGIEVQRYASCPAARALAVVLREADQLEGRAPRERAEFSGSQWRTWYDAYHRARDRFLGPGPSRFK